MKAVATFSGGLDSTVLLYHLLAGGHEVLALSVDYGQRHRVELTYAEAICKSQGIRHEQVDLSGVGALLTNNSQTAPGVEVPEGHYAEETMKATVVPNRNMMLLSVAIAWAINEKADAVAYAAHGGDHAIYPDCRPRFADAVANCALLADWHTVELLRPFIAKTKADIVSIGAAMDVPFVKTWSCYKGGEAHCGKCGTCVERREAFELAGVEDPTEYTL